MIFTDFLKAWEEKKINKYGMLAQNHKVTYLTTISANCVYAQGGLITKNFIKMKEFIRKWSNWWILNPKRKQLDDICAT